VRERFKTIYNSRQYKLHSQKPYCKFCQFIN